MSGVDPAVSDFPVEPVETDILDTTKAGPQALRGSALRAGGYLAGVLLSLISAPLLIRHLGVVAFGEYLTVVSLVAIVSGVTEGGLAQVAVRDYATLRGEQRDHVMANALGMRIALTVTGGLGAVAFAAVAGYSDALVLGTALAATGLLAHVLQTIVAVPLQAELRFGWVTFTELLRQIVQVALIIALVVLGAGVVGFLATSIAAGTVALAATVVVVRGRMPLRPAFHPSTWAKMLRETLPYAAAVALSVMYFRLTIIVMSLISTGEQTGYFATSLRVVEVLIGLPAIVLGAAFPILARSARDDPERFRATVRRLFGLSAIVGVWVVVCTEVGAEFAIHVLGGSEAEPAVPVLQIQGLALVATFIAFGCAFPLLARRRHGALLSANIAALVVSLALAFILVPAYDARGGAIAAVTAEFVLALTVIVLLVRSDAALAVPLRVLGVAAIAGAIAWGAATIVGVHELIGVAIATAVYAALIALTGHWPPEVSHALQGIRRR